MIEQNAVIEDVSISSADHGVLSAWVFLKYLVGGQGFGGYALYLPDDLTHSANQKNYAKLKTLVLYKPSLMLELRLLQLPKIDQT